MIEQLLPSAVVVVEAYHDVDAPLLPDESAAVARAVDKRRREFTTVRHCARTALAKLGAPATAIPRGDRGAPRWPDGYVGSMTHCDGYRAAAVARSWEVVTLGIDAEPHQPLPDGVLAQIASAAEQEHLAALAREQPGVHWDRLLFSAKESVYKAWFPVTKRWLGFEEARLTFDPAAGTFHAELLVAGLVIAGTPRSSLRGRYAADGRLVVTAIAWETG